MHNALGLIIYNTLQKCQVCVTISETHIGFQYLGGRGRWTNVSSRPP